jgi:uncharacterized repeat protein (TIGR01451 family)
MKRLFIRLAALAALLVLGVVAVVQAQRMLRGRESSTAHRGQRAAATSASAASPAVQQATPADRLFSVAEPSSLWQRHDERAQNPLPYQEPWPPRGPTVAQEQANPAAGQAEVHPAAATEPIADGNVLQAVSEVQLAPPPNPSTENPPPVAEPSSPGEPLAGQPPGPGDLNQLDPAGEPNSPAYAPAQESAPPEPLTAGALGGQAPGGAMDETPASPPAEPMVAEDPQALFTQSQPPSPIDEDAPPAARAEQALPEGTGRPGNRDLEGVQAASLSVEKIAPAELQVGRGATFQIKVRNTGTAAAKDVQVIDVLPKGTRLASTNPPAELNANSELVWSLGRLRAGEEMVLSVEVVPLVEGEIGSVATARFAAEASARTVATRPQLTLQVSGPRDVLIGQEAKFVVKVANVGSGAAAGVVLLDQLPPNFSHPAGQEVEYSVGVLGPNESRDVELTLMAARPGRATNAIVAYGEGNLRAEDQLEIEVLAPALQIAIEGSERRFLERQAAYTVTLTNAGTAAARSVELLARLPEGLQFVEANNLGEYEVASRTVHWRLEELPAGESGSVTLVTMPNAEGNGRLVVEASAAQGLTARQEQSVTIEGVAGTSFEVVDIADPIEVKGETSYEIRVLNQGTKAAANLRLAVVLPDGLRPLEAQGPTPHVISGGQVIFEPLARLAPKADTTYQVRVQAEQAGDMRVRVQLLSDDSRTPVTKEESTRVFGSD